MGNIRNDVIKQNGVSSVGTLYRECMGRVVFCREGLIKLLVGVINCSVTDCNAHTLLLCCICTVLCLLYLTCYCTHALLGFELLL